MRRVGVVLAIGMLAGCAKRVDPPVPDPARGQAVFAEFCSGCHPGGQRGVGPALEGELARPLVVFQVRRGHGIMPAFHEELIDDRSLDDLVSYVMQLQEEARTRREARAAAEDVVESLDTIAP